jgi:hypothetical protein
MAMVGCSTGGGAAERAVALGRATVGAADEVCAGSVGIPGIVSKAQAGPAKKSAAGRTTSGPR